ncbi:hypothetical protein Tco_0394981 [Tanacetum coccineum]
MITSYLRYLTCQRTHTWRPLFRHHPLQIICLARRSLSRHHPHLTVFQVQSMPDDEIVAEDQPYAEDASPMTAQSPDYVPETDPEADPEEDDDEDPEEDPIDYPADGGDDGDDEMDIKEDEDD